MTANTSNPQDQDLKDGAAPALVVPKLKPKFRVIHHVASQVKRSPTLASGISTIEDAVKIAWALAENRKAGTTMVYAEIKRPLLPHVRRKEESIVAIVSCDYARRQTTSAFNEIGDAKRAIEKWAKEMAIAEQRSAWINAHLGGFSSPRCEAAWKDQPFRTALLANDFPSAWSRVLELESERQVAA